MGQYYGIILKDSKGVINYNMRRVAGDGYMCAKLMEHSYNRNSVIRAVASVLAKGKCQLVWCGDYAEEDEINDITKGEASYIKLWGEKLEAKDNVLKASPTFSYKGKYLVNHTKGVAINLEDYVSKTDVSPISLLTAVGNGRGGGDYYGKNEQLVGDWAWDEIQIMTKNNLDKCSNIQVLNTDDILFVDPW